MKILKRIFLLIFLLCIYIFFAAKSYTKEVCDSISNSVFRLHVIANSDSDEDQNLKYLVRDNIIEYIDSISIDANSKEDVIKIVENNIDSIKKIAVQTIIDNGFNYPVNVKIGNFSFPTKYYGDIALPAGLYDALRIEIGEAKGKNWWCVMFPPLCFIDVTSGIVPDTSKELMKDSLNTEEYNLISESNTNMEIKFKIVEVLQNLTLSGIFM